VPAAEYNDWVLEEGSRFTTEVQYPGINDATGYAARMHIRSAQARDSVVALQVSTGNGYIGLDSVSGYLVISVAIPATALTDLHFVKQLGVNGLGYYDLEIVPPSGEDDVFRILRGSILYSRE